MSRAGAAVAREIRQEPGPLPQPIARDWIACACGKRGWRSKDGCRRSQRRNGQRLRLYLCSRSEWHATRQEFGS